jgi:hypothetical protein
MPAVRMFRLVDPPSPTPETPPSPDVPIVDDVSVDKTEVCRGEENFINVKAHTTNGTDAFVAIRFHDPGTGKIASGSRIPFRLDVVQEREMRVVVEGKGGAAQVVALPPVEVKDCVTRRQIAIEVARAVNSADRVELTAKLTELPPEKESEPFEKLVPVAYEWNLGDGTTLTSRGPTIEHSYEGRDQTVVESSFLVTVKIKDDRGNEASGSRAVWLPNLAFAPLVAKGRVVLSVGVEEADPSTNTPEKIWLYHGYPKSVRIDRVRLRETVLDGVDRRERETFSREYAPSEILGFWEIPPGKSLTARDLSNLQPTAESAVRIVEVLGQTADGKPARGAFTLLPINHHAESEDEAVTN